MRLTFDKLTRKTVGNSILYSMTTLKLHTGNTIDIFSADTETELKLPFVDEGISAGFPSPALDFIDLSIDLNKHLVKHPSSTFYGRVKGDSLKDAGITNGDLLIIDKSLEPQNGKIAVCYISVGIAPTKALSKLANRIAKKYPIETKGVYIIDSDEK